MQNSEVTELFVSQEIKPNIVPTFDEQSERRPAWLMVHDLDISFVTVVGDRETTHYIRTGDSGYMIPTNATEDEQRIHLSLSSIPVVLKPNIKDLRVVSAYEKISPSKNLIISMDNTGDERPAWVRLPNGNDPNHLIKFLSVVSEEGVVTYYKLRVGDYYLPLNASSEEEHLFHSKVAKEFDEINSANKQIGKFIVSKLNELNIDVSGQELLDLYCATGMTAGELQELGFSSTTLLDFSQEMIDVAKNKPSLEAAKAVVDDFFEWEPKDKFSVVVCVMGMHYHEGEALNQFLEKVDSVLEDDGLFICAQPSAPSELRDFFDLVAQDIMDFDNHGNNTKLPYFIGRKRNPR